MKSIIDFCERHRACREAREWLEANCADMADAWHRLPDEWLIWVATRPGVLSDRELRIFAVSCARQVEHLLVDQRSRDAIDAAERFAKSEAKLGDSDAAWAAAREAVHAAATAVATKSFAAAYAATAVATVAAAVAAAVFRAATATEAASAGYSAAIAAGDAARARAAARDSAWDAARAEAWADARASAAAMDAARASQAEWIRANTKPNFGVEVQT